MKAHIYLMLMLWTTIIAGCAAQQPVPACPPMPTPLSQVIDKTCDIDWRTYVQPGDQLSDGIANRILKQNQKYDAICGPVK